MLVKRCCFEGVEMRQFERNAMPNRIIPFFALLVCCLFMNEVGVHAAVRNANSPSSSDVQSAINSASSGDTVNVPSGKATWSTTVSIPSSKKITLQGSGMDSTVITLTTSAINMNESGSRVTGFGFILSSGDTIIEAKGRGWRIDHCRFNNTTGGSRVTVYGTGINSTIEPAGLVDHNIIINGRVMVNGMGTFEKMSGIWAKPLGLGTDDAVYVEDNTFTRNDGAYRNAVDANRGGKYVFRYNHLTNTYLEAHSLQSDQERATRKFEIYNNTINSEVAAWSPMFIRGGTGVIFNNTVTGRYSDGIVLDNVRDSSSIGVSGSCNGSSSWDGNTPGQSGWPCRDQIGRSTDASLWTSNGSKGPAQASDPAYFWNNKMNGADINVTIRASHIQRGRDVFINTGAKPGYTPFTYPHPLSTGGTVPNPVPGTPGNLRIQ